MSRLVPTRDVDDVELRQTLTLINMMVVSLVVNLVECGGQRQRLGGDVNTEWQVSYLISNHDESCNERAGPVPGISFRCGVTIS